MNLNPKWEKYSSDVHGERNLSEKGKRGMGGGVQDQVWEEKERSPSDHEKE